MAAIRLDKFTPVYPGLIGKFNDRAINAHNALIDAIELINQRLNPVVVQM